MEGAKAVVSPAETIVSRINQDLSQVPIELRFDEKRIEGENCLVSIMHNLERAPGIETRTRWWRIEVTLSVPTRYLGDFELKLEDSQKKLQEIAILADLLLKNRIQILFELKGEKKRIDHGFRLIRDERGVTIKRIEIHCEPARATLRDSDQKGIISVEILP